MPVPVDIVIRIGRIPFRIPRDLVHHYVIQNGEGSFQIDRNPYIDKIYALLKEKEGKKIYFKLLIGHRGQDFSKAYYLVKIEKTDHVIIVNINIKPEPV